MLELDVIRSECGETWEDVGEHKSGGILCDLNYIFFWLYLYTWSVPLSGDRSTTGREYCHQYQFFLSLLTNAFS